MEQLTKKEKIELAKIMFKGQDLGKISIDNFVEALENDEVDFNADFLTRLIYHTVKNNDTYEEIFDTFNYQKSQLTKLQIQIANIDSSVGAIH